MDSRFLLEAGTGIFTGNELIVKGALANRVGAITGYPGSPLAELFETLEQNKELFNERAIVAQIANNEALAAARLNGSQMAGVRALAVMKNVGLHVAADGLALGNMAGAAPDGLRALTALSDRLLMAAELPVPVEIVVIRSPEANAFAAPGRSGAMVIPRDVLELRAARVKTKSRRDK